VVNQAPTQPSTTVQPYVPQAPATPPKSSKKISDTTSNAAQYQVMAKYINPIGLERIRAILPTATRTGDRINLGSFSEKSAADTLIARLKEQGIPAWRKQG
jgi:cell division septation protein DedD